MLPCGVGRLLNLFNWEPVFPRVEWGFHVQPPYEWEVESLRNELEEVNGHWFVYNNSRKKKFVKGTINGTPYSLIIFWLYIGKELDSVHSLTTSCGSEYCLNPDHITLTTELTQETSVDKPDKVVVNYSKGPPVFVTKSKTRRKPKTNNIDQRLKCITRKIWFPDEDTALRSAHHSRIRSYKCNMCDGWHHTHKGKESSKVLKRRNRKMPYS